VILSADSKQMSGKSDVTETQKNRKQDPQSKIKNDTKKTKKVSNADPTKRQGVNTGARKS
jgi:hypothetical protein